MKDWRFDDGYYEKAIELHKEARGKMEIVAKVPVQDTYDLSLAYSPGVAQPCMEIQKIPKQYTITPLKEI